MGCIVSAAAADIQELKRRVSALQRKQREASDSLTVQALVLAQRRFSTWLFLVQNVGFADATDTSVSTSNRILLKRAVPAAGGKALDPRGFESHRTLRHLLQSDSPLQLSFSPVSKQAGIEALEVPEGNSIETWLEALNQHPGENELN